MPLHKWNGLTGEILRPHKKPQVTPLVLRISMEGVIVYYQAERMLVRPLFHKKVICDCCEPRPLFFERELFYESI